MPHSVSQERRSQRFVYREFQRNFVLGFCVAAAAAVLAATLSLVALVVLWGQGGGGPALGYLAALNGLVVLALLLIVYWVAMMVSHRVGGPLHRFEQALAKVAQGDLTGAITLRRNDQLKSLAQSINHMTSSLNGRVSYLAQQARGIRERAAHEPDSRQMADDLARLCASLDQLFIR